MKKDKKHKRNTKSAPRAFNYSHSTLPIAIVQSDRTSAEINALSRYMTNRFEEVLSNMNGRFDEMGVRMEATLGKFDAFMDAGAKTFNIAMPERKSRIADIVPGACYWLAVDMFEREVAVPVVIREVYEEEVEFEPLVGNAETWETVAKKSDFYFTKQEALAAIMPKKEGAPLDP